MNKLTTLGILSVLLIAGIGIASAMPWGPGGQGQCAEGDCTGPSEEQRAEIQEQREAIKEAILNNDWDTYSSLRDEYGLDRGIHAVMTEEAFSQFSEIAQLREQIKTLHEELADELGLEGKGPMQNGFMKRRMGMRGMGPGGMRQMKGGFGMGGNPAGEMGEGI